MEIIPSVAVPNSIIFLRMITNCVGLSPRLFLLCHRGSLEFQDIRSSERKLSYRFQLCNLGKPKGAIGASGGARATLLLINTALRDGVRPALIAIKPLKRLVFISRGEAPARQPVLIGTQRTTRAAGPIAMDSAGVRLPLSNRVR